MAAWAFVVGINAYPSESGLATLAGAVADAEDFAEWALEEHGGGVADENLFFWTCEGPSTPGPNLTRYLDKGAKWMPGPVDFSRPPNAAEISTAIEKVAMAAAADKEAERLYVFFAGHGIQTREKEFGDFVQVCFLAGDFGPDVLSRGVVGCGFLESMLKAVGPPEIVMLLDMCRSKAALPLPRLQAPWNLRASNTKHKRIAVGRAAQSEDTAFEVPHGQPTRGAFTQLLVEGLRQHRKEGVLMVRDLDDYVTGAMPALVHPEVQYPEFNEVPRPWEMVLAEGEPVLPARRLHVTFTTRAPGEALVLVGGPENAEIEIMASVEHQTFALVPGAYVIETAAGEELVTISHVASEDSHVEL